MSETKFGELVDLVNRLRDPKEGCPWDREQTPDTLKPFLIEEAYEVIEAIEEGDAEELKKELGDLMLQVVFHAQIANENGQFSIEDVIQGITAKMIRRHPHVFGDQSVTGTDDVLRNWEAIKAAERKAAGKDDKPSEPSSILDGVSTRIPALLEANQLTERAARVGFDWPDVFGAMSKLLEENDEVIEAIGRDEIDADEIEAEVGDLLFAAVNVARLVKVDPEAALRRCNRKFKRRFKFIEAELLKKGKTPADSNLDEMDALWTKAKTSEQKKLP
ncbi:MAG TPA: nucleoside triphosphate pyrophosphohydrolase [Blastocatellia bacterium]|nr:nucleoside triphosphate pyrophosphohydrolase [Blastocatellia bacterium]